VSDDRSVVQVHGVLVGLYPRRFREEYRADLVQFVRGSCEDGAVIYTAIAAAGLVLAAAGGTSAVLLVVGLTVAVAAGTTAVISWRRVAPIGGSVQTAHWWKLVLAGPVLVGVVVIAAGADGRQRSRHDAPPFPHRRGRCRQLDARVLRYRLLPVRTMISMNASLLPAPPRRHQPGLLRRILADPAPVLDELAERHGPMYGFGAGPLRMAVIGDPAALRELFAMPTEAFRWGHKFNVLGFVVGKGSMIVSDGEDHTRRRGSVQAAFSRRRLNGFIPMIVERTDQMIDRLTAELAGTEGEIDLYPLGRQVVLEVVVRSLFGDRLADRSSEIGALFERPQAYLESPAIRQFPHPFPATTRARVRADRRALDAIIDEQIAILRSEPSSDPLDVLAVLVADGTLGDAEIRDQVVTLIGAGYDTTAASLSWMFWCVSLEPGLWRRLRTEADDVFGPLTSAPVADHRALARLELATRVMRETTRLHPAGVLSPREAARDVNVGGYRIPKGTLILWSAHLAGRDPRAWAEPLRFDPDRFRAPSEEQKALADMAWAPFGRGVRNCIGFALAQMELTLTIARIAQRLDITATADKAPRPVGMVVNRPAGGAPMRVSAR
jgi:cytochrome P450